MLSSVLFLRHGRSPTCINDVELKVQVVLRV